jgi:putative transposase
VLTPNHVHLILVPRDADALRRALAPVHRSYAGHIHLRQKKSGHFWQGRFGCVAMDEAHLGAALRYVALNPVRARLVARAVDWPWSSVHAHLGRKGDGLTQRESVLSRFPDFAALIKAGEDVALFEKLRQAETIGRALGSDTFLARLERKSGRVLKPAKRGRKRKPAGETEAEEN